MTSSTHSQRSILFAVLVALPFVWAPLVASASGTGAGETVAEAGGSTDISDADIEAFAAALTDVQEIGQAWTQRMQEAEDQEEIAAMREDARDEMAGAIEDHGLTVEEYNEIATAAQDDPELAQRIQQAAGGF